MEELRLICRRLSLVFFYVTTVPAVMVTLERGMQARAAGYHEAYTYVSSFPGIVNRMANAQAVFFYVFLASMPEKKKGLLPIAVYLVYSALTLLTGRRIYFTAALLMIFFYFLIRSASREEKWITRRHLIGAAVLAPFLILLLQAVFVMRENKTGEIDGIFGTLKHFLGRQGYTVILIKYVQEFAEKLGRGKFYSFYNTIRFFRTNVITRHFVPQDYGFEYGTYTVETATLGNSLANSVTYLKYPNYFLRGGGTGSCYAAELFLDFGYIGVLAGNFVYGLFFRLLRFMRKKGTVLTTIALIFMNDMIRTPRYNFDQIMQEARYPSEWILLLLLAALAWGIWKLRRHREKNPDI
jgi:oligosaccharide repeat unit polymerase